MIVLNRKLGRGAASDGDISLGYQCGCRREHVGIDRGGGVKLASGCHQAR